MAEVDTDILDGELVYRKPDDRLRFGRLGQAILRKRLGRPVYVAFELPYRFSASGAMPRQSQVENWK